MRRLVVSIAAAVVVCVGSPAQASHAPTAYCSESGDVCASTKKVDGVRLLRLSLAAKYFDVYTLCVRAPDGSRVCKKFDVEKTGSSYGDVVKWSARFPDKGPGAYVARWKAGGTAITPKLGFHVSS